MNSIGLPAPARYFPFASGVYEVTAGLRPLGADFGNGDADRRVFQFDHDFARYRENKIACIAERAQKYVVRHGFDQATEQLVTSWLLDRLLSEYPDLFNVASEAGGRRIVCRHTGDEIALDEQCALRDETSRLHIPGTSAFDALALQVPEDICVMKLGEDGRDWLAAAHVCSPSGWSPEQKMGQPFTAIHAPVPHIERINAAASRFVDAMIHRGPFVRFVWGIATDDRLNHHPEPPPGWDQRAWRGEPFAAGAENLFVRVERQITCGLPQARAAVFTIRLSHLKVAELRCDAARRTQLHAAFGSMSAQSLRYKGLAESIDAILAWLQH